MVNLNKETNTPPQNRLIYEIVVVSFIIYLNIFSFFALTCTR